MKRKKIQKKKSNTNNTSTLKNPGNIMKVGHRYEISGILLLAFGLLLFLSFYVQNTTGMFGVFIRDVLLGLLGFPALIIPFAVIAYAAYLIIKHKEYDLKSRLLHSCFLFILVSAIVQSLIYTPEAYYNLKPIACITQFYVDGAQMKGGGVLGGVLSLPFLLVFQKTGAIIILTALTLVEIILVTNSSISNFIMNLKSLFTRRLVSDSEESEIGSAFGEEPISKARNKSKIIDFEIVKNSKEKDALSSSSIAAAKNLSYFSGDAIDSIDYNELNEGFTIEDIRSKRIKNSDKFDKSVIQDSQEKLEKAVKTEKIKPIAIDTHHQVHTPTPYRKPPYDLLKANIENGNNSKAYRNQVIEGAKKLEETLGNFGVSAKVVNVTRGPTVTRYELQPSAGVKVSRIVSLSDDISLNLAASGVRIEAPIPGKAAIGIEVPNKETNMVTLREVLETNEFEKHPSKISFAIGKDISGECIIADIAKMPHLLIAGATGSGKSVCINSLITSILYKASPEEVKLLMIDPKVVELGVYNGIPHLLIPVVTEPKKAAGALNWAVQEMVNRYKLFAEKSVRDLNGYNELMKKNGEQTLLPQIVIIIDELADLMMVAPNDVEDAICRLAQMARAAGMHLVIATQRPSVNVITGVIKANIPSRISFAVTSHIDSRTILDMAGAEKLLGRGDMLFHPVGRQKPVRIQGANITDAEVEKVVEFVKTQGSAEYDDSIIEEINSENTSTKNDDGDNDELLPRAIELVVEAGQASVSLIQRKFKVGYARAARIVDQMEARGIIGGYEGSKPRQILISKQEWHELQMSQKQ